MRPTVSHDLLLCAADTTSGSTSVFAEVPTATVSVVGVALDSASTVNSVRFEPGNACNITPAGATATTTNIASNAGRSQLTVTVGGSGLLLTSAGPDNFSICVEYTARLSFYYRVNTTLMGGELVADPFPWQSSCTVSQCCD